MLSYGVISTYLPEIFFPVERNVYFMKAARAILNKKDFMLTITGLL